MVLEIGDLNLCVKLEQVNFHSEQVVVCCGLGGSAFHHVFALSFLVIALQLVSLALLLLFV